MLQRKPHTPATARSDNDAADRAGNPPSAAHPRGRLEPFWAVPALRRALRGASAWTPQREGVRATTQCTHTCAHTHTHHECFFFSLSCLMSMPCAYTGAQRLHRAAHPGDSRRRSTHGILSKQRSMTKENRAQLNEGGEGREGGGGGGKGEGAKLRDRRRYGGQHTPMRTREQQSRTHADPPTHTHTHTQSDTARQTPSLTSTFQVVARLTHAYTQTHSRASEAWQAI